MIRTFKGGVVADNVDELPDDNEEEEAEMSEEDDDDDDEDEVSEESEASDANADGKSSTFGTCRRVSCHER